MPFSGQFNFLHYTHRHTIYHPSPDESFLNLKKKQLTSKAVDKASSRYRAPHYLCLSMREEEDSTISITTGKSEFEVSSKKPSVETMNSARAFVSKQATGTRKTCRVSADEQCGVAEEEDNVEGKEGVSVETFPPKVLSMHRVRWNLNKGSERWLCYGGAAGLLRCQQIDL